MPSALAVGKRYPVGSLELLELIYRSTPLDLVRKFGARKIGETYEIPLENTPWITMIDLGSEYPLLKDGGVLTVRNIKVFGIKDASWWTLTLGYLVDNMVLGITMGANVECRSTLLTPPLDLWEVPRSISFKTIKGILKAMPRRQETALTVPLSCIEAVGDTVDLSRQVKYLVAYVDLVSLMGTIILDLYDATITYETEGHA